MTQSKWLPILCIAMFGGISAGPSFGAEDHQAHHPAEAVQPPAATLPEAQPTPLGIPAGMKKMHEQMAAIRAAKDPGERAKLMDEHMRTMQSTMSAMKQSDGCMTGGSMRGNEGGMGMMQMMMDQMMQHQDAMRQATPIPEK